MVVVGGSQGEEAVPHPSLDVGFRHRAAEVEVAELSARLEPGVRQHLIGGHHLQRTDDLVSGGGPLPALASHGGELEEPLGSQHLGARALAERSEDRVAVGDEEVPAQRHDVAEAQLEALTAGVAAEVDAGCARGGVPEAAVLLGLHRPPTLVCRGDGTAPRWSA